MNESIEFEDQIAMDAEAAAAARHADDGGEPYGDGGPVRYRPTAPTYVDPPGIDLSARIRDHARQQHERSARKAAMAAVPAAPAVPDTSDLTQLAVRSGDEVRPLFLDAAAILSGEYQAPQPDVLARTDGACLLYRETVNQLVGDPESGKTFLALYAARGVLENGGRVVYFDADHNGIASLAAKFGVVGVDARHYVEAGQLLFADPEDKMHLLGIVEALTLHPSDMAVFDSVGEIGPLFGADSNSADDYTELNRRVFKALAKVGTAVVLIDHYGKGEGTKEYGTGSGTAAKKRAADGTVIQVDIVKGREFTPGAGGKARLVVEKDRHGAVREASKRVGRHSIAGHFEMFPDGSCQVWAPGEQSDEDQAQDEADRRWQQATEEREQAAQDRHVLNAIREGASSQAQVIAVLANRKAPNYVPAHTVRGIVARLKATGILPQSGRLEIDE